MIPNCVICTDAYTSAAEAYASKCGHIFHYHCVLRWLQNAKSCPQCRAGISESKLIRIYFNFSEGGEENAAVLTEQVDNLRFQIRLKEQENSNLKQECSKSKDAATNLRNECKKLEHQNKEKDAKISGYKYQLEALSQLQKGLEQANVENKALKNKIIHLQGVEAIISGSEDDVRDILKDYDDSPAMKQLGTYCSILKKELVSNKNKLAKNKELLHQNKLEVIRLRTKIKDVEVMEGLVKEKDNAIEQLDKENESLRNKMKKLEAAIISPSGDVKNSAVRRFIHESPAPAELKRPKLTDPSQDQSPTSSTVQQSDEASPYLRLQMNVMAPRITKKPISYISRGSVFKKPTTSLRSEARYDGLGGHSSPDHWPKPNDIRPASKINKKTAIPRKPLQNQNCQKTTLQSLWKT